MECFDELGRALLKFAKVISSIMIIELTSPILNTYLRGFFSTQLQFFRKQKLKLTHAVLRDSKPSLFLSAYLFMYFTHHLCN